MNIISEMGEVLETDAKPGQITFTDIGHRHITEALGIEPNQVSFIPCDPDGTTLAIDLKELDRRLSERGGFRIYFKKGDGEKFNGETFIGNLYLTEQLAE